MLSCFFAELSKREKAELDHDAIAHRLREDVVSLFVYLLFCCIFCVSWCFVLQLEQAGKLQRQVADSVSASIRHVY